MTYIVQEAPEGSSCQAAGHNALGLLNIGQDPSIVDFRHELACD